MIGLFQNNEGKENILVGFILLGLSKGIGGSYKGRFQFYPK